MCCSFQDVMTSKTLALIRRLKIMELIVWTSIFEAVGSKAEGSIS